MTSLLRRVSVGARFTISFGLILALTLVTGAVSFIGSQEQAKALQTNQDVAKVVEYVAQQDFYDADISSWQAAYGWDTLRLGVDAALDSDSGNRAGFLKDQKALMAALDAAPTELMTTSEQAINKTIAQKWNEFFTLDAKAVAAYQAGDMDLAEKTIIVDDWQVYQEILGQTATLKASVSKRADAAAAHAVTVSNLARILILSFAVLAVALVAMLLVALVRTVVVPLRELTTGAEDLASRRLSQAITTVRSQPADAPAPTLPPFHVDSRDELAGLASAFNHLQDSALDLAIEQHRNDRAAAEMLVNLGRRNQSLLTRLLSYLVKLEREERNPQVLDQLFRIDHLSTRVRRNAESMLVLAGADQTRTKHREAPLAGVVRAALAEIEDYARVDLLELAEATVHGQAAPDITHLLAELLENATRFSPNTARVTLVGGHRPDGGYRLSITDFGVGMTDEELAEANQRISQAAANRANSLRLGHHVVGLLAARWELAVSLGRGASAGIVATIDLPASLVERDNAGGGRRVQSSATAERATAPANPRTPATPVVPAAAVDLQVSTSTDLPQAAPTSIAVQPQAPITTVVPVVPANPNPRRVRGAQLGELGQDLGRTASAGQRPQVAALPAEAAAPAPAPAPAPAQLPAGIRARVRGAQLPTTGDVAPVMALTSRSAEQVRKGLSGLQSGVARARRDSRDNAPRGGRLRFIDPDSTDGTDTSGTTTPDSESE